MCKKHIPRVYRGRSLSASGRMSCPDDDTVAQNLRYESRMFMQKFVTCSWTTKDGLEGISFAAGKTSREKRQSSYLKKITFCTSYAMNKKKNFKKQRDIHCYTAERPKFDRNTCHINFLQDVGCKCKNVTVIIILVTWYVGWEWYSDHGKP